jgi:hypothetical protein
MTSFPIGTVIVDKVNSNGSYAEDTLDCTDINAVAISGTQTISGQKTFLLDILLSSDPSTSGSASNKHYVDSSLTTYSGFVDATYISISGDTMSGALYLNADPTLSGQASNKHYVDSSITSLSGAVTTIAINTPTSGYTLALSDASNLVDMNSASAMVLTVPKNSVVAFPVGTVVAIRQKGAGQVTITPVDGTVTLNSANGLKTSAQYAMVSILQVSTNVWAVTGSTST